MPSQDEKRASGPEPSGSPGRRLSRRSLLQGAATAGAAGLAVTAIGAAASPAVAATRAPTPNAANAAPGMSTASHGHGEATTAAVPTILPLSAPPRQTTAAAGGTLPSTSPPPPPGATREPSRSHPGPTEPPGPPNWNRRQSSDVTAVSGFSERPIGSGLPCPPCNIGPLSTP